MDPATNPVTNPALYARAERAALDAFLAATSTTMERRAKLMDRAAIAVFKKAGTPRDAAELYGMCITADIIERERSRPGIPKSGV